jgi:hypothetical protein
VICVKSLVVDVLVLQKHILNMKRSHMRTKQTPLPVLILAIVCSVLYIINPTAGLLEFIPDNMPLVGNLDEAGATAMLLWAIAELRKRNPATDPRDVTPPSDS